jgi:hypothetical protein
MNGQSDFPIVFMGSDGEALASEFLKTLRDGDPESVRLYMTALTDISQSFMVRFDQEGGQAMLSRSPCDEWSESFTAFRGQYCGFFNKLCEWLATMARSSIGANLDQITCEAILERANAGIQFDEAAYLRSCEEQDRLAESLEAVFQ